MEILARGIGRRKEAVAQVQIVKGTGLFIINNIPAQQYLHNNTCSIISVKSPLTLVSRRNEEEGNLETMDTIVKVKGGGLVGQAEAIKLGLARALCQLSASTLQEHLSGLVGSGAAGFYAAGVQVKSEGSKQAVPFTRVIVLPNGRESNVPDEIRKQLKDKGFLTQDSRVKERRKYGLKKARKATQYNKR
jgi:small subunit ribosomal protein S9